MAYPLQNVATSTLYGVWFEQTVAGAQTMVDWASYVTDVTFSQGSNDIDLRKPQIEAGTATITLKNPPSNGGTLAAGLGFVVTSNNLDYYNHASNVFAGKILEVDARRVMSEKTGVFDWMVTVTAGDLAYEVMNVGLVSVAPLFTAATGETQRIDTTWAALTNIFTATYSTLSNATLHNIFVDDMDFADLLNMLADVLNQYVFCSYDVYPQSSAASPILPPSGWRAYIGLAPLVPSTAPSYIATDGTHTTGTPNIRYIDIDYGRSNQQAINKVVITNKGLQRGLAIAGATSTATEIDVTYTGTQTSTSKRTMEITSCVSSNNLGWNYIPNTLTGTARPTAASTTYFKYQNNVSRTRNGHGSCRVLVGATYTAGQSVNLLDPDDFPDMVTLPAGGTTGNWYFRFYAQAHSGTVSWSLTPGIRWYDVTGTLLSTTSGTAVNITSTSTWTAVTVNAAKPANAVTALPFFNVGTVNAVGNSFYITDACFGQLGGYMTFDGDTADTSTYLYTWTGNRWASPSQLNDATTVVALANYWLTRNQLTTTASSMTCNYVDSKATQTNLTNLLDQIIVPASRRVKIWVDGVAKNYTITGAQYTMTPWQVIIKMTTLEY